MVFSLFHLLTVDEKGEQFQRQASFPLFLLSYLRYIFTKFFFEDLQLSTFFCQRTASPLTDCSSITDLIASHNIFAVRFFSCLPTSATEKVVQNPKEQSRKYVLISSTQKNTCWRDDRGESVSSLGTLWHHWILPPLQLNCTVQILRGKDTMTRAFWQKNCYYSNYGRLVGRYWRYFWLVVLFLVVWHAYCFFGFNVALLNQISADQVAGPDTRTLIHDYNFHLPTRFFRT